MSEPIGPSAMLVLEGVVEHLPDMVFIKDAVDLRFVLINRAGEALLGLDRAQMIGKADHDFFPAEEADFFVAQDRAVLASGALREIVEEPVHTPSGVRYLHTKKFPILDNRGVPIFLLGISRDVTEWREQRLLAEKRERRLSLLLAGFPGVVWTTDADLLLRSLAGSRCGPIGIDPASIGKPVADCLPPASHADLEELHRAALGGEQVHYNFRHLERFFDVQLERLSGADGNGVIGIAIDVTERQRLAEEQQAARVERVQRMESLGLLASAIAHDFSNLLIGILGNTELAEARLPEDHPARNELDRVAAAAERAGVLVRRILAFSSGQPRPWVALDLSELVWEAVDLVSFSLSRKARLGSELANDLPMIERIPNEVRQIAVNLLTNASEALGDKAGSIQVSTSVVELDAAGAAALEADMPVAPGAFVVLAVEDDGIGMDEATRRRIFTPSYEPGKGTGGVGLGATLGILKRHRGGIRVRTEPGKGTVMQVFFPVMGVEASSRSPVDGGPAPADDAAAWVLVVDDDQMVRELADAVLSHFGFRVETAASGGEAAQALVRHLGPVGGVLLDLNMPGMEVRQTVASLRAVRPGVPILLSSGFGEDEARRRVADPDVGFLSKPYTAGDLLRAVRSMVGDAAPPIAR